jgi:hypothetical protein
MLRFPFRLVAAIATISIVLPQPALMRTPLAAVSAETVVTTFNAEQLDALLAPIALYPDALLVQMLMAMTYPLQVVETSRWLEQPANKDLKGDALATALEKNAWDPSVKSLVPFPQVLAMLNGKLDWMQQLGYAFAIQQADVMNSVQRLRRQAQAAGSLHTTEQQRVVVEKETIIIEPASAQTVYVPLYSPNVVYGAWPYPAYPPVYVPPPPGYVAGSALIAGIAFATGVAIVGSLWGWARPMWYGGNVNINVNRYNSINVNRVAIQSNVWRPPAGGVGGRPIRPPGGPVGGPNRPVPLPANAIGRPNVQVPGNLVNRPAAAGGSLQGGSVPRPVAGQPGGAGTQRPSGTISRSPSAVQRPAGAFGGITDGARATQFSARGAQSLNTQPRTGSAAVGGRGAVQSRAAGRSR